MSSAVIKSNNGKSRPRILLLGKNGQVGSDLQPLLVEFPEVLATDRASLDLTRPDMIRECVRSFRPDVIVNAAAYTAVDRAETEPDLAAAINATAPGILAEEAAKSRSLLVHYSTDYVFDGVKPEPYLESDPVNPLNVYGKTKAAGEEAIRSTGCNHFIFRTSWVYSPRGSNFFLTILRLAREKDELKIVDDQIGTPTSSRWIAQTTVQALRRWLPGDTSIPREIGGTYHLTAAGYVSWFGFASEIISQCAYQSLRVRRLIPTSSSQYPSPARRPLNSRLNCSKIEDVFDIERPDWRVHLSSILKNTQTEKPLPAEV